MLVAWGRTVQPRYQQDQVDEGTSIFLEQQKVIGLSGALDVIRDADADDA